MNATERQEALALLIEFRDALQAYRDTRADDSRSFINRNLAEVYELAKQTRTLKFMSIAPPPAVGGFVQHNVDVLHNIFTPTYRGVSLIQAAIDGIEQTIGVLQSGRQFGPRKKEPATTAAPPDLAHTVLGYQLAITGLVTLFAGFVVKSFNQSWLTTIGAGVLPILWFVLFKAQSRSRSALSRALIATAIAALVGASVVLCVVYNDELKQYPGALTALQVVLPVLGGVIGLLVLRRRADA